MRDAPNAPSAPNTVPMAENLNDCFNTSPATLPVPAPNATRIPISFVRCVTRYDSTP